MLEGAERRTSMCQAFYQTFSLRERYIVPVSSNFLTQISCGIKTKCRKTRAMQKDFTIVDSLALRQCNTSMIPDTHLLKLLFLARYYLSLNLLAFLSISIVLQICFDKKDWYNYLHSKSFPQTSKRPDSYFYESGRFIISWQMTFWLNPYFKYFWINSISGVV